MAAQDEFETITVRLPKKLKALAENTARARGATVTALIREALEELFRPTGKLYQLPGLSEAFDVFIEAAKRQQRPVLILVNDEHTGNRYFFHGEIDAKLTNASLVAIRRFNEASWVIPRRDVVAWFEGEMPAQLTQLAVTLERQGWARRSAA